VVAIEPATGRVLAMAEHSELDPAMRGLCTKAIFPAASIFKIVTSAALLEAGVTPGETTCFHGGKHAVTADLLTDSQGDGRCVTFDEAMGLSANVAFAKLTARYLDADHLLRAARALHFNQPWPFPVPTDTSLAAIPDVTTSLAETGAGFGDVYLSPLHGAVLAATVGSAGQWRWPVLFEKDVGTLPPMQAVDPAVASQLAQMMALTVSNGTARRVFHERGHVLDDAAGKTGSLADKTPVFRDYSWFVGFAPRLNPRVAVAAVVVNDPHWRIRGAWLGREALRLALERPARR
jgi:cell division protein FtsI/penicillin-binding protein 2